MGNFQHDGIRVLQQQLRGLFRYVLAQLTGTREGLTRSPNHKRACGLPEIVDSYLQERDRSTKERDIKFLLERQNGRSNIPITMSGLQELVRLADNSGNMRHG